MLDPFSDRLLELYTTDIAVIGTVQTFKGWIYVGISALLIYLLILRWRLRWLRSERALRVAEARYRLVSEQKGQIVYSFDLKSGDIEWWGDTTMTGYDRNTFNKLGISGWEEHIHPEDRAEALFLLRDAEKRRIPYDTVYRFRGKNGEYLHIEDRGVFHRLESGDLQMFGIMRDISKRVVLENQFRKKRGAAEPSSLSQETISAFKGIMSKIVGTVVLLKSTGNDREKYSRCLENLQKSVAMAEELLKNMANDSGGRADHPHSGEKSILVVDDDDLMLETASRMLEVSGYKVVSASGGKSAVELFSKDPGSISLVILDVSMPEMDGIETAKRLKEIDPSVSLIMTSGSGDQLLRDAVRELGKVRSLTKPYSIEELSTAVGDVLES